MADSPPTPETLPEQYESDDRELAEQGQYQLVHQTRQYYKEGPIPPVGEIAAWQELVPDAPERFLVLLEQATAHDIEMDKENLKLQGEVVRRNFGLLTTGQVFGFIIAMTAILTGAYVILSDYALAGSAMSSVGVGSLVGLFLYTERHKAKEKGQEEEER